MSQMPPSMPGEPNEPSGSGGLDAGPVKSSGLALAALILGIFSILCPILLPGILAIIFGVMAVNAVNRDPMRLTGRGQAIGGIVTGAFSLVLFVIALPIAILLPALGKAKELSYRSACAANLSGITKCLILYSADNNDRYPYLGNASIEALPPTGANPGGLMNDMYYMVGTGMVAPKQFICRSDNSAIAARSSSSTNGNPPYAPTYWTNGNTSPGGADYSYSYSFAFQYSAPTKLAPFWANTMDSGVAIGADLNPGTSGPWPRGVHNSHTHQNDGQNVGFGDDHVEFQRTPACGEAGDNIYINGRNSSPTAGGCLGSATLFPYSPGGEVPGTFDTCLVPGVVDTTSFRRQ